MASQDRFGYEWDKYNFLLPVYEEQFLMWIGSLNKGDFFGKSVLDAGCGMGRNSFWACKYGAKELVAFDYDQRSIEAAKKNLEQFPQASVKFSSIYDIDYLNKFDIVFSIGVIHHLGNPKLALQKLFQAVKPGGKMLIWVYGYENNEWVVKYINPIRKITSRLPLWLVHFVTYIFSVPLYVYLKLFPHSSKYLKLLKKFSFRHIHLTVFDQLIPKIANYWKKSEVENLISLLPGNQIHSIYNIKGYSWTLLVEKK